MDMQPIEPHRPMTAQLTAGQWNAVLQHLDAGPHRIVRPIIDSLMAQLQQQLQAASPRFSQAIPDGPLESINEESN